MRVILPQEVRMRGDDRQQGAMYSYISPEARVPHDHPLRAIRGLVDDVLRELSPRFEGLYARVGRPSIAPEQLLRAQLLQILYTIRSERQLMEQLDYNLLFRWFVGLNMDEPVWDPTVFTKHRQRLLDGEVATAFLERVVALAQQRRLLSGEHFTVDGTLIEAWASVKSFTRKDGPPRPPDDPGNPTVNFHGERRSNLTHASTTDPEARLVRKGVGQEAKLGYQGHALPRVSGEPTQAQARRGDLRLAQDRRVAPQDAAPRRAAGGLDLHLCRRRLQSRPDLEPDMPGDLTRSRPTTRRPSPLARRARFPSSHGLPSMDFEVPLTFSAAC